MSTGDDIKLICRQCGQEFVFTRAEQDFYEQQGFVQPRRCPQCRAARQKQVQMPVQETASAQSQPKSMTCQQCGTELDSNTTVFCTSCMESIKSESEQETARIKKASNEAHSKLMASDAQRAKLTESLRQQEQTVLDLQLQIQELSAELEKAYQFHNVVATLQPALSSIEDRLKGVEYAQNKINERMLQLAERVHVMYENTSLLDVLKRGMGQYGRQQGTHY